MTLLPLITSNTKTATFLILQGYNFKGISYELRDGKPRGFFVFERNPGIETARESFENGNERVDLARFEAQYNELITRIVRGMP